MTDALPPRRLGAIGTLVWDCNWHPTVLAETGEPLEQWGGAVYFLSSLAATCPPGWEVEPIIKVGEDRAERAFERLASLPHVSLPGGIRAVPEQNNRVELRYHDASYRSEQLTGGVPPWTFAELEPHLPGLDALYVNYIAGTELGLEDTQKLRAAFPGLMYGDLHSLFLGEPGPAARPPRALPRSGEWLACFDIIQLNEAELGLLSGGRDWEALLRRAAEAGVKLVVVTLGPRGVRYGVAADLPADPLRWPKLRVRERRYHTGTVAPPLGELPGDPTGCGDVWGASFLAGLLARMPLEDAIVRAQRLAAEKMARADTATLYERFAAVAAPVDGC